MHASITSILKSIGSGVITIDPAGQLTTLNPAARMLLDLNTTTELSLPESMQADGTLAHRATSRLPTPGAPLRGAQGERVGTLLVLDDLTEWRVMEDQMRRTERLVALGRLGGGLAIIYDHGGTIDGHREPGQGTQVVLWSPTTPEAVHE